MQPDIASQPVLPLRQQVWKFFLLCTIPVHLWTILVLFRDVEWVLRDFNFGIYLGYVGFALTSAFLESLVVVAALLLIGLTISRKWSPAQVIALHFVALAAISIWAAANQVFFILLENPPAWFDWILLRLPYRQTLAYNLLVFLVVSSAVLPVALVLRRERVAAALSRTVDRLTVLAYFYLGLDVIGLFIVIIRLIRGMP
jgi:hypothetical protein